MGFTKEYLWKLEDSFLSSTVGSGVKLRSSDLYEDSFEAVDPLELELQVVVRCLTVGAKNWKAPWQEQQVLLATEHHPSPTYPALRQTFYQLS